MLQATQITKTSKTSTYGTQRLKVTTINIINAYTVFRNQNSTDLKFGCDQTEWRFTINREAMSTIIYIVG